jgi:Holliday junction resolvase RusA-like endonuclease
MLDVASGLYAVGFGFEPPSSWSKARKVNAYGKRKATNPDADNLWKALLDAMFSDDSWIWRIPPVYRIYTPRPQIILVPWDDSGVLEAIVSEVGNGD